MFNSKKKADDEAEWELQERCKSRCIWVTGDKGLTEFEAAELIIQEAKKLIADDLHQMGVDWKPPGKPLCSTKTTIVFFVLVSLVYNALVLTADGLKKSFLTFFSIHDAEDLIFTFFWSME